jgi:predicted metal-dependent hydrolase
VAGKQMIIPDIGPVTLYKRRGSRNLRLSFSRDGGIRVSIPYWVPYQAGIEFAKARSDWIIKHQPSSPTHLHHQDRIGKAHRLIFRTDQTKTKPSVRTASNQIVVSYPATMTMQQAVVQAAAERGALKALKSEAEQLLPQRLRQLAQSNNFSYRSVGVKKLASRWGSCSQHGDVTLNLFLMQLPWHLIDYVLIHELVHTEHLDHSPEFWKRFEQTLPGAKKLRKELKNYRTIVSTMPLAAVL